MVSLAENSGWGEFVTRSICLALTLALAMPFVAQVRGEQDTSSTVVASDRLPIPTEDAREAARVRLYRAFPLPQSREGKLAQARELLEFAEGSSLEDPSDRYVCLEQARSFAVEENDLTLAFEAAERLASEFEIDRRALLIELVQRGVTHDYDATALVAEKALEVLGECLVEIDAGPVELLVDSLKPVLRRAKDEGLSARFERLAPIAARCIEIAPALDALATTGEGEVVQAAERAVGSYLCFVLGEFDRGLPHLVRSGDSPLGELASRDVSAPTAAAERIALADAWKDWGVSRDDEATRRRALGRAVHWYGAALAELAGGLDARYVEAQLEELRPRAWTAPALAPAPSAEPAVAVNDSRLVPPAGETPRTALRGSLDVPAAESGLAWLARHQSADGYWDCDGFMGNCSLPGGVSDADGPGKAQFDVGVTSLALLAFLSSGSTTADGPYRGNVQAAVRWLVAQQDLDSGRIGPRDSQEFLYEHAYATIAIGEAIVAGKDAELLGVLERAVEYSYRGQSNYSGWGIAVPAISDDNSSVTGLMLLALASADAAGVEVEEQSIASGFGWLDDVTDPNTGRIGFNKSIPRSSRYESELDRTAGVEALTALGVVAVHAAGGLCDLDDVTLGERGVRARQVELLTNALPEWDPDTHAKSDMYYWLFGTQAMALEGGRGWRDWRAAFREVVEVSQRTDGDFSGSWDPVGPWGSAGGRVYATAVMTLACQAPSALSVFDD